MITPRRILVGLLFALFLVFLSGGPADSAARVAPDSKASGRVSDTTRRFTAELKNYGFEVSQGYFHLWDKVQCPTSFEVMETCYFNNPTAPYVVPVVPYWGDEFVDPATRGALGETKPGYGNSFRFDSHEAIVIFGFLPPEAAYFGLQSYLFTRNGHYDTENDT